MECPNCASDDIVKTDGPAGLARLECVVCELRGLSNAGVVNWDEPSDYQVQAEEFSAALRDERDVFDDWKREV